MRQLLTGAFLASALLSAHAANAITIEQLNQMDGSRAHAVYVSQLIEAAEESLAIAGQQKDHDTVVRLFSTNAPGVITSIGMNQFRITLALILVEDARTHQQTDVADVLAMSLEQNAGVKIPDNFFRLADKIKPDPALK